MRKVFLSLFFLTTIAFNVKSQMWVDLGIKGGWGPTILFNKNALDDKLFEHKISFGNMLGGKIGWNFNDDHEITIDVMGVKNVQKYDYFEQDTATGAAPKFEKSVTFNTLSIALAYRHNKDGRHFEIGPVYNIVRKASATNTHPDAVNQDGNDIKSNLNPNFMSILFGFGGYFLGTENLGLTLGARFTYGLGDLISDTGRARHYPYFINESQASTYSPLAKTTPFTAMLVAELNLDFAYMAKAKCKNKRKLILF